MYELKNGELEYVRDLERTHDGHAEPKAALIPLPGTVTLALLIGLPTIACFALFVILPHAP